MVRVPRAVFEKYWHCSYAELIAAVECGQDGLSECGPRFQPFPNWTLCEPQQPANMDDRVQEGWRRNLENWQHDIDHAYFREGTDSLSKGKALLYQQGW